MDMLIILLFLIGAVWFLYYWIIYKVLHWICSPVIEYFDNKEERQEKADHEQYVKMEDKEKVVEYSKKIYLKESNCDLDENFIRRIRR